jgi:hypothetical protein
MILVRLSGGLGNQMFQYAFGFFLATKNNTVVKMDQSLLLKKSNNKNAVYRDYSMGFFSLSGTFASDFEQYRFKAPSSHSYSYRLFFKVRNILFSSATAYQTMHRFEPIHLNLKNCCIVGRWQSELYFEPVKEELKKEFQFKNELPEVYKTYAVNIKREDSVGVHVRRGDYVTNELYAGSIGALSESYYQEAINLMKLKMAKARFFVFSEDLDWCKDTIKGDDITFVDSRGLQNSTECDLHLISLCKHHIISNSTFSWWGAWLGERSDSIVIAPEKWAKMAEYIPPLIVPDRWLKINNHFE